MSSDQTSGEAAPTHAIIDSTKATLEILCDAYGLGFVLDAISDVCWDKSQHVAESWQDMQLAKAWGSMAERIAAIAEGTTL